jgi:hypothetical protein
MDLLYLIQFIWHTHSFDQLSLEAFFMIGIEMLKKIPILQQALSVVFLIIKNERLNALSNFGSIVYMMQSQLRIKKKLDIGVFDQKIGNAIVEWIQMLMRSMDKEQLNP